MNVVLEKYVIVEILFAGLCYIVGMFEPSICLCLSIIIQNCFLESTVYLHN